MRRRMQIIFQDPYASLNPRRTVAEIVGLPLSLHGLARNAAEAARQGRRDASRRWASRPPTWIATRTSSRAASGSASASPGRWSATPTSSSATSRYRRSTFRSRRRSSSSSLDLKDEMGLTYLFISHDISVIGYLSDRVAVMYLGEIVEIGPVDSVSAPPPPLHAEPDVGGARSRPARPPPARAADRRPALAAQSAVGLQVPHPLPARHRHLPAQGPGDRDASAPATPPPATGCTRTSRCWSASRHDRARPHARRSRAAHRATPSSAARRRRWTGAADEVQRVARMRLDAARERGALRRRALRYLAAQRSFAAAKDPRRMAELAGIAEGFGVSRRPLFMHLHLGTLQTSPHGAVADHDGCSAWAVADGPDGPLAVKNRDFSGSHAGIQRVFRHDEPDLAQGPMLCLGSLGSPGAYSSGMNAAGLAVVDTQVGVRRPPRRLAALLPDDPPARDRRNRRRGARPIRAVPHAGGGTLVLADRHGGAAAVELGASAVATEEAPLVCRTNHFTTTALGARDPLRRASAIDASSTAAPRLPRPRPSRPRLERGRCRALMGEHAERGAAQLCHHGSVGGTRTISSAVYCCRSGVLHVCLGIPVHRGLAEFPAHPLTRSAAWDRRWQTTRGDSSASIPASASSAA